MSVRGRRRRRALVVTLVLLLLGFAAGYGGWWLVSGRFSSIPNVGGLARSVAVDRLEAAGYRVADTIDTAFSETVAAGAVVATDPAAGARGDHGKTVALTVSAGKERFTVPTVAQLAASAAQARLATIPVQVVTTEGTSDTVPKGVVIGTNPKAGTLVKRNSVLTLTVSTGPPILTDSHDHYRLRVCQRRAGADRRGVQGEACRRVQRHHRQRRGHCRPCPSGSALKFSTITVHVSSPRGHTW